MCDTGEMHSSMVHCMWSLLRNDQIFVFLHKWFTSYTQIKKTVNTENIPGMCDLTNHMRDPVTAENEWVLSHGIELFRKMTRFNLHQFILQKLEVLFLSI